MPITAVLNGTRIDASLPDMGCGRSWSDVHRVKPRAELTCPDCGGDLKAVERTKPNHLRYFAHMAAPTNCALANETYEHHYLKTVLANAARDAGAHADIEVRAADGSWRADVLATVENGWRVALEAQLSPITEDVLHARTANMKRDGVDVCWVSPRKRPPWLGVEPSVRLVWDEAAGGFIVAEGIARYDAGGWREAQIPTLATFVGWMLTAPRNVRPTTIGGNQYLPRYMDHVWTHPHYVDLATHATRQPARPPEKFYSAQDAYWRQMYPHL